MRVEWLEQSAADLPSQDDWLSAAERVRLDTFRFAKRRADWRLGRWTAKHAVAAYLTAADDPPSLAAIEIRPAPSGAPEAYLGGQPAPVAISLSHRSGLAACATAAAGVRLGCDLEIAEPRSQAFAADYFTPEEQARVADQSTEGRWRLLALLWSAKESVLKALHTGLRADPRSVQIESLDELTRSTSTAWHPLRARYQGLLFEGQWRETGGCARTYAVLA